MESLTKNFSYSVRKPWCGRRERPGRTLRRRRVSGVIEKGKKEYTTEAEELTVSGEKKKETTKYQMINQMLSAKQLGKEEELKDVLETYRQREAWIASLFRLME